jgi:hypothetical protein
MDNKPNVFRETRRSGLDDEKSISAPVKAELFFLTSLFIELIDLGQKANRRRKLVRTLISSVDFRIVSEN